jgi:hypothetical protein
VANDLAHLVGLQMADEVPADIVWELWLLGQELLHAAFAEEALAGIVDLL